SSTATAPYWPPTAYYMTSSSLCSPIYPASATGQPSKERNDHENGASSGRRTVLHFVALHRVVRATSPAKLPRPSPSRGVDVKSLSGRALRNRGPTLTFKRCPHDPTRVSSPGEASVILEVGRLGGTQRDSRGHLPFALQEFHSSDPQVASRH